MNKTILAVAILTMAAFAGVMIVGDDTDAAGEEEVTIYSVTYVTDVGTFKIPADASNKITLMDNGAAAARGITKTNYTIVGWNVTDAGVTQTYSGEITLSKDISVTPSWKLIDTKSSVIFLADGKIIGAELFFDAADQAVAIPDAPSKKGCIFVKYVDEAGVDAPASIVSPALGSSKTYKAVYAQVFDVTFMLNGAAIGEPVKSNVLVNDGTLVQIEVPSAPIMENYTFAGWADKSDKIIISYSADAELKYSLAENYKFVEDTTLYAKFVPNNMTVTFQVGEFSSTQTVLYGAKAMKPVLPEGYVAWMLGEEEFNFDTPITENITLTAKAGEVAQIYTITFEIVDKAPVIQKSDSMVIPDTVREGYMFQGWVVKGESQYVDPAELVKTITSDITFVAVYKAVEVVEYTVTFVNGDEVIDTVKVIAGQVIAEVPEAPEGMFWLFNKDAAITGDITIEAKPLTVAVQFAVGEKVYNAYTQTVAYGEKIDVTKLADFIFPEGFDSWNYDFNEPVTADMTVFAKAIPAPEKEPAFYQTPMGQCAIILTVFIVGLVFYGIFTGRIAVPKFKISRVEKAEAPVEQLQEEKKP